MKGLSLFNEIRQDLKVVEGELHKYVGADLPTLADASAQLLKAGGKRLRPAFVLLTGKISPNYSLERLLPLAVALELIHMASLVHDDVIDDSDTRRGTPTVRKRWGNRVSIHSGDHIFGRSLSLLAEVNHPVVSRVLAETSVEMCKGEIQQIYSAFDIHQSIRDYFYRIKRKTALLISASCQLGAVAVDAPDSWARALKMYGHYIGMAFQITDDILDLTANEKELGKPVGGDLRQGIITLPIIIALKRSGYQSRLAELVAQREKSEEEVREAINLILQTDGVSCSRELARRYLEKSKERLTDLPEGKIRKNLGLIADFIDYRKF